MFIQQFLICCAGLIPASKLVPTFPASSAAAGSGYASPAATAQTLKDTTTALFGLFSVRNCLKLTTCLPVNLSVLQFGMLACVKGISQ